MTLSCSQLLQEAQLQERIGKHENIQCFVAAFEDASSVYLVSDLCNRGELISHFAREGAISERSLADAIVQLMQGVSHCHKNGKP